jgi:hypothetical protein
MRVATDLARSQRLLKPVREATYRGQFNINIIVALLTPPAG